MIMAFELTMPHAASWNGRWSGQDDVHVITYTRTSKTDTKKMEDLDGKRFTHCWNDGWVAQVECRIVDAAEARRLRKANAGFCGYDWMVRNIWAFGEIDYEGR